VPESESAPADPWQHDGAEDRKPQRVLFAAGPTGRADPGAPAPGIVFSRAAVLRPIGVGRTAFAWAETISRMALKSKAGKRPNEARAVELPQF